MKLRNRCLLLTFSLLTLLVGTPCWLTLRQVRQMSLDRALIAAIKQEDAYQAMILLDTGADANAEDRYDLPSPGPMETLKSLFQRNDAHEQWLFLHNHPTALY